MGSKLKHRFKQSDPYLRTLYIFNILSLVGGTVYGMYYGVFLYKQTQSLSTLALDGLIGSIGTWLGYLFGIAIIRRYGYGHCLKLAFGLFGVIALLTAALASHIAEWFLVLAIIRAIPAGLNASAVDTMVLREVSQSSRTNFLQLVLGFEFMATVVLPVVLGAIITTHSGYQITFVLAGCIFLSGLFVRVHVPKPDLSFNIRETLRTFRRPLYIPHAANRTLAAGFNQMNGLVSMIIPFLLFGNELRMGAVTSVVALVAAVAALSLRKVKPHRKLKLGYGAHLTRGLVGIGFVVLWSPPLLMVWQLICKLATPFHDPLQQSYDIHNDSLILGSDIKGQALQINVLNNTLSLIGSITAYSLFYGVIQSSPAGQRSVLQILIITYFVWRLIGLSLSMLINRAAVQGSRLLPDFRSSLRRLRLPSFNNP